MFVPRVNMQLKKVPNFIKLNAQQVPAKSRLVQNDTLTPADTTIDAKPENVYTLNLKNINQAGPPKFASRRLLSEHSHNGGQTYEDYKDHKSKLMQKLR